MENEDIFYKAMLARDHRFDGKFFVGVKTTGIYCRPICPAKPKRENVEFFSNYHSAEKAGYRPCLRCRPESAPMSPVWIGTSAMVRRAIKVIHQQEALHFNEDDFAALFGVSARHLRRVFRNEIGKTPKELAFECRLNLSRKLISETELSMTDVAFASGFQSIRRFNDAFKLRFKKSPRDFRKLHSQHKGEMMSVTLSYRPPFDFHSLLMSYRNHSMGNLEWFTEGEMVRFISLGGKVGKIHISNDEKHSRLKVGIDFPDSSYIHHILSRVRVMFDLDSDPVIIANSLEMDPEIKRLLKGHPGIRLPSGWDPFETAISVILGQLVSVEMGRKLVADLIELLGEDTGISHNGEMIKLFPTPQTIYSSDLSGLKTTQKRKETLKNFSKAIIDGELTLHTTQPVEEFCRKVQLIKGIGPWTADYMALKVLRHTDSFPKTDLIIARALGNYSLPAINEMAPWRGYVAALMWREFYQEKGKT